MRGNRIRGNLCDLDQVFDDYMVRFQQQYEGVI